MTDAQATYLPDGKRLHLHHGPIDMIVGVTGPGREAALSRAATRFDTLLEELVAELPRLRSQSGPNVLGETAHLMVAATRVFHPRFVTPMAAVAGAGADTILRAMCNEPGLETAYVNNGGDVAMHIAPGHSMTAALAGTPKGRVTIRHDDPVRGIATSGWRGRSHSLGIADSVTVLAQSAAMADAAATMIANAVDVPEHPAVTRQAANEQAPDSDLGTRLVTTSVGDLDTTDISTALENGVSFANTCRDAGMIQAALLTLQDHTRVVGNLTHPKTRDLAHA